MTTTDRDDILTREPDYNELGLPWLASGTEWGVRGEGGRKGLTLEAINVGSYGDVPDISHNYTMRPRGAAARPDAGRIAKRWPEKAEVWSASVAMLYEEALARQWSSATDIPWAERNPLPDDLELAICQLCTFLTQVEFIAADVPGRWLDKISPDFYEVQLFLGTQIMDEARHMDVFRKRALANGGGLMAAGAGAQAILATQDFTEMTAIVHLVGEGFVQSVFRMGELIAPGEVEKKIFRLAAQDESRHVAFGVSHLKNLLDTEPERREELHHYLDLFEGLLGTSQAGLTTNPATSSALSILLGGGVANIDEGRQKLLAIRKRQINEYMHRLEVIGLHERRERMNPELKVFLDPPKYATT
jgi:hypothetical protein